MDDTCDTQTVTQSLGKPNGPFLSRGGPLKGTVKDGYLEREEI